MVDTKVSSATIKPLVEEGEDLVQQLGMIFRDFELLKHTPLVTQKIVWNDLFSEIENMHLSFDPALESVDFYSHPLIFPHVFKALASHHIRMSSPQDTAITHTIKDGMMELTFSRASNLWDHKALTKLFFPLFDKTIPAPHWDLSIILSLVQNQLQGELTSFITPHHCGFTLVLPLELKDHKMK